MSNALSISETSPRTEHTATLLPQTETLLVAGQDTFGLLNTTEMFNPGTEAFRTLTPTVQILRSGHTATGLIDGRVLIFVKRKTRAEQLGRQLKRAGLPADSIHGDKSAESRHTVLKAFELGFI